MRKLNPTTSFKRNWKKASRSGLCSAEELQDITDLLIRDYTLPKHLRDHALSGQWKQLQARDCHVTPDLILIYSKQAGELRLASHSEPF